MFVYVSVCVCMCVNVCVWTQVILKKKNVCVDIGHFENYLCECWVNVVFVCLYKNVAFFRKISLSTHLNTYCPLSRARAVSLTH